MYMYIDLSRHAGEDPWTLRKHPGPSDDSAMVAARHRHQPVSPTTHEVGKAALDARFVQVHEAWNFDAQ